MSSVCGCILANFAVFENVCQLLQNTGGKPGECAQIADEKSDVEAAKMNQIRAKMNQTEGILAFLLSKETAELTASAVFLRISSAKAEFIRARGKVGVFLDKALPPCYIKRKRGECCGSLSACSASVCCACPKAM